MMLHDVIGVRAKDGYRLELAFDDGVEGVYDASNIAFEGVFKPLRDPTYFARVHVDPELGTVVWPNGADLDPMTLYAAITGQAPLTSEERRMIS